MGLKHFLALKFPKYFEDKRITQLKRLGVNFNEDVPGNFIPVKHRKTVKVISKSNIEEILNSANKKD
ncbi:hypothetical protein [Bacillus sp. FJAT-29937]|uniref:hypothetical protein n=1 Tax=Bacillus sp. FJAT-29937 TaxID=1720553 RepID=UPI0008347516|nr:hypothetical protein [Bacillus sp. FJAT-29937]